MKKPHAHHERIVDFGKNVLFKNLQDALDNAQISNSYIFKVIKNHEIVQWLKDGLYKISITNKNKKIIKIQQ